jgi:hypothetical protein
MVQAPNFIHGSLVFVTFPKFVGFPSLRIVLRTTSLGGLERLENLRSLYTVIMSFMTSER